MLLFSACLDLGLLSALIQASFALPWASADTQGHIDLAESTGLHSNISLKALTTRFRPPPLYPIECFDDAVFVLEVAVAADCEIIINEIILRLNSPMEAQIFGFDETADIDLSLEENYKWHHGQCIISVDSMYKEEEDKFRPVDVAIAAQRIIRRCVLGSKDAHGGHTDIGSLGKHFYVIVGGIEPPPTHTISGGARMSLPSRNITKRSDTKDIGITARSNSGTDLIVTDSQNLPIVCIEPGMPAAGNINRDDCSEAIKTILSYPDVLLPQSFTTEPTGGIHVPKVHQSDSCFLTINTNTALSKSSMFGYIKVAYYASEIIRRCSLGGVVRLTPGENGFYVSLTGVNTVSLETGPIGLFNSSSFGFTSKRRVTSDSRSGISIEKLG